MTVTRTRITCDLVLGVRVPGQRRRIARKCGADAVVRHVYYAGDLAVEELDYCRTHEHGDPQRETLAQRVVKLDL